MKIAFIAVFITISSHLYSQSEHWFLTNDSIHYKIVMLNNSLLKKHVGKKQGYFVVIDMPKSIEKSFRSKNVNYWMQKLSDPSSDWAANLILYYIYQQNAILVNIVDHDKSKWNVVKAKEIEYWQRFFKNKK